MKVESLECLVCAAKSLDAVELRLAKTKGAGTALECWLSRYSPPPSPPAPPHVCRACLDLISVLERAELEYLRLREAFEVVLRRNPLFASPWPVKSEIGENAPVEGDSEDEPLARAKKKRPVKKKRKPGSTAGRKAKTPKFEYE